MKTNQFSPQIGAAVGALAGAASALIFLAGLRGGAFASFFLCASPLMLFLAGLGWGRAAVVIGAFVGAAIMGGMGGFGPAVVFVAFSGLAPIFLTALALSRRLREQDPTIWSGQILVALAGLGGLLVILILGGAEISGGVQHIVEQSLGGSAANMAQLEQQLAERGVKLTQPELVRLMTRALPPAFAAGWLLVTVATALLAQEILARSGRALCPPPPYSETQAPRAIVLPLIGSIALCFAPGWLGLVGSAFVTLFGVVYFFLGLAVIHAISRRLPARPLMLGVIYLCLALFVVTALVVALLGFMDQWADFRSRAARQGRETE